MSGEKYRALVIDDEPIVRKSLALTLEKEGFDIDSAADGKEAEELIAQNRYDVIITDMKRPNEHGADFAEQLLATPERPLIIIHTALEDPKLMKDLLAKGVDDVIFKSTDRRIVAAKVSALVARGAKSSFEVRTDELDEPVSLPFE